jgi:hypothetical protein
MTQMLDSGQTYTASQALAFAATPPLGTDPRAADYCYTPCEHGLHVCGFHPDGENFLTVMNLPATTAALARAVFDAARAEVAGEDSDRDLVVDLMQHGACEADFPMNRQMLERLAHLWAASLGEA